MMEKGEPLDEIQQFTSQIIKLKYFYLIVIKIMSPEATCYYNKGAYAH